MGNLCVCVCMHVCIHPVLDQSDSVKRQMPCYNFHTRVVEHLDNDILSRWLHLK